MNEQRTALYRLFDAAGRVLYIGITASPSVRFAEHRRTKAWWSQVARKEIVWFNDRHAAGQAEATAIINERPKHKERARLRKAERRKARAPKRSEQQAAERANIAAIKAREADLRKDWAEKTSTMLARNYDVIRFEKLNIKNMTRSAAGTVDQPGANVRQKAGLNRAILAQGWGQLRTRTGHKAAGRVEDVPAPYTSLRCSDCGWIDKNSRKSQARFVCSNCGFTLNADHNAAINVAAGQGHIVAPRPRSRAGGTTRPRVSSVREPQPFAVGIPHL